MRTGIKTTRKKPDGPVDPEEQSGMIKAMAAEFIEIHNKYASKQAIDLTVILAHLMCLEVFTEASREEIDFILEILLGNMEIKKYESKEEAVKIIEKEEK